MIENYRGAPSVRREALLLLWLLLLLRLFVGEAGVKGFGDEGEVGEPVYGRHMRDVETIQQEITVTRGQDQGQLQDKGDMVHAGT